eukprot:c13276_g1_i1 orf=149-1744(+)
MEGRDGRDMLNFALCDELLAEILSRVCDPVDHKSVSLVSKRWQRVQRHAKCKLGLCIPSDATSAATFCVVVPSLLAQHPYITCLSIKSKSHVRAEHLVALVVTAIAASCKHLKQLYFTAGPINATGLEELSTGCPYLSSLELLQPASASCLPALCKLTSLKMLSLRGHDTEAICSSEDAPVYTDAICSSEDAPVYTDAICSSEDAPVYTDDTADAKNLSIYGPLHITKLSLINIRSCTSCNLRWLWRSCDRLQNVELFSCDGVGDMATMSQFADAMSSLQELKLYRCRGIAGEVLTLASKHALGLKALTVHDGADTEGLRLVLQRCRGLEVLDLRLPLDLSREDLMDIGRHGKCLRSLRLHSCWMATGADMQSLASNINSGLEELVLIRCRAIFQDPGTLASIGQSLSNLKSIDLSENEYLTDKEVAAMLAACEGVRHLNLWKCCRLTDKVVDFIGQRCVHLESIDIRSCGGISTKAVTNLLMACRRLKAIAIEPSRLSTAARRLSFANKRITLIESSCPAHDSLGRSVPT